MIKRQPSSAAPTIFNPPHLHLWKNLSRLRKLRRNLSGNGIWTTNVKLNGKKIKCVIWDLDDTIWDGTLAEGEAIAPRDWLVETVKQLDAVGVINSICSKNEFEKAKVQLQAFGLWDYFVFPVIDFVPKGQNIKSIIERLQLRDENCLFIDDNEGNLAETAYYCPSINTANPYDDGFRSYMEKLVAETQGASRLEQYKILETKHEQAQSFADNESFLHDSAITVCVIRNPEDLTFKDRIIDLANRTNQLNFTKSRFADAAVFAAEFESIDSMNNHHGVVFAYDKYGDYGLVGFYAFDESQRDARRLSHFFFSCRIMNMGVELAVARYLAENFRVQIDGFGFDGTVGDSSFVSIIEGADARTKDYIAHKMEAPEIAKSTIIAGCTSGVISHYLPDNMTPTNFQNFTLSEMNFDAASATDTIIYTVYSDYITKGWSAYKIFSYRRFRRHLEAFLHANSARRVFLLLASEAYGDPPPRGVKARLKAFEARLLHGRSATRNRKCNALVKQAAAQRANVYAVNIDAFIAERGEVINARHFHRNVIKRASRHIGETLAAAE